jgi:flagellar biosynthetic protein FliR
MLALTTGQLEAWLAQYFWPFVRIGACMMVAPVFGAQFVPARVRLLLAFAVTLIVAPLLTPPAIAVFSAAGMVVTVHQVIIGVAMGFALQIIFDSLAMGGQLRSTSIHCAARAHPSSANCTCCS